MSEPRHSETLIWAVIAALGLFMIGAQLVAANQEHRTVWGGVASPMPWVRSAPDTSFTIPDPAPATEAVLDVAVASTVDLFLEAIVQIESAGDPRCVGQAGERGLMQLKRGTWKEAAASAFTDPPSFEKAFDPAINRRVGQAYLAQLQSFLHDNHAEWNADMRSLLAACYNAGPSRVEAAGFSLDRLPSGTQSYVDRVTALHDYYLANPAGQVYANRRPEGSGS